MKLYDFACLLDGKTGVVVDVVDTLCIDMLRLGLEGKDRYKINPVMQDFMKWCNACSIPMVLFVKAKSSEIAETIISSISELDNVLGLVIGEHAWSLDDKLEYVVNVLGSEQSNMLFISEDNTLRSVAEARGVTVVNSAIVAVAEADNLPFTD